MCYIRLAKECALRAPSAPSTRAPKHLGAPSFRSVGALLSWRWSGSFAPSRDVLGKAELPARSVRNSALLCWPHPA